MKSIIKYIACSATVLVGAALVQSCAMEAPFGDSGEGTLSLNTQIRSDVKKTRGAVEGDALTALREKCVVYIENDKGVIRKYKGLDNIPAEIKMRTGSYVAEAWSGDSVSASFDSKFYRGWQRFNIEEGANHLELHCNIANVIVSIAPETAEAGLSDLHVSFSHSRGVLEFDESNMYSAKGYFMMPNADKDLAYTVTGKTVDGTPYEKKGKIENVERAHEYQLRLTSEAPEIGTGGALIKLTIVDIPVIEEVVEIFPAPQLVGDGFDVEEQVVSVDRDFSDTNVYMVGYNGMRSLKMNFSSNFTGVPSGLNLVEGDARTELRNLGISVESKRVRDAAEGGNIDVDEYFITFSKAFLDALPESAEQYVVTFDAEDGNGKIGGGQLRIANTNEALDEIPVVTTTPAPDPATEPMAVRFNSAEVKGMLYDDTQTDYGVEYRASGASEWKRVKASAAKGAPRRAATRALVGKEYTVRITGLEPGTVYEYRAYAGEVSDKTINTFKTESKFIFPNASFEDWSTYKEKDEDGNDKDGGKDIGFPGSGSVRTFWDSGNQGAMTLNRTICDKSTDMVHSGTYSARLHSEKVVIALAAGNVFVGYYDRTDGTNGVLQMGREYNGSHPDKLAVWANYRPGKVDYAKSEVPELVKGENDHGQIYVALTDEPIEIRTNKKNQKLFDVNDPHVLAYGQVTWKEAFGPDGSLERIEIPLEYKEAAKTTKATHVVVTCCASKFGDYFAGSSSSVLYLDDFEFVYE